MSYHIKEIYYTLQGEGAHTGRAAVFCRMAGCNLWSGLEKDRSSAICQFCDTDFVGVGGQGGGHFGSARVLAEHIQREWLGDARGGYPYVVFTGGEPLLQLDEDLINACHELHFEVAVETNGTVLAPPGIDWICVSPKVGTKIVLLEANELKLVYPQDSMDPEDYLYLGAGRFYLQPKDCEDIKQTTAATVDYCLRYPHWRLSLQTHKWIGLA